MAKNNIDPAEMAELRSQAISEAIRSSLQFLNEPVKSDEEVKERINLYFAKCEAQAIPPSVEALCIYMGISTEDGKAWSKGEGISKERYGHWHKAMTIIEDVDQKLVTLGILPQVQYIWRSKNFYNMREPSSRMEIIGNNPLKDLPSLENIQKKYLGDLPEAEEK